MDFSMEHFYGLVVYFEIQADSPERAAQFYSDVFDWTVTRIPEQEWEYWTIAVKSVEPGDDDRVIGGLLRRPAETPPMGHGTNAYVCTVQVEDFDRTASRIEAAGGIEALPRMELPGGALQGYFVDTEGNTFGVRSQR